MEKIKAIKSIKSGGLRLFLLNKLKKYDTASIAESVQRTLHLSVTRSFDLRTMTALMKPMRRRVYERFKESVSGFLEKRYKEISLRRLPKDSLP